MRWTRWFGRWRPGHWLLLGVGAYALLLFLVAHVRLVELQGTTWDLGIYQQALWSASHGGPFYESADFETGAFGSFLQVHSAFVLYLVAPLYGAFPDPNLLLAVQSVVVAAAAVPLYLLTRAAGGSARRGLLTAGLFLVWAPTIAASLYDFHIEAFLPLELFAVALFFQQQRYGLGFAAAVVSFATMEFAPVLTFFLAVFFCWPTPEQRQRVLRSIRDGPRAVLDALRSALADHRLRASLLLMVASVVAYYALLELRTVVLAGSFGFPTFPPGNRGYVIGATPSELGLRWQYPSVGLFPKLELWFLLYALVGFLPLFAPRTFVVAIPVVAFVTFSANLNYASIGFQYGFLFAIPVFLGVAYGLARLRLEAVRSLVPVGTARHAEAPRVGWRRVARRPPAWAVAVGVVVVLNLLVGPLDPMLHGANAVGSGYRFTYTVPPGYADARAVAALVPAQATVVATDDLFPFVANSAQAYSFFWTGGNYNLYLPFSPTKLPDAVLVSQDRYYAVTPWLAALLYNTTDFGTRGVAWSTPAGPVLLFLAHYQGPEANFGAAPASRAMFGPWSIAPGPTGVVVASPFGPYRTQVESEPLNQGLFVTGPWTHLSPGQYNFTVGVRAWAADPSAPPAPNRAVFFLNGDAFGTSEWISSSFAFGPLSVGGWVNVTFPVTATGPLFNVEIRGYSSSQVAVVAVGYLSIAPAR